MFRASLIVLVVALPAAAAQEKELLEEVRLLRKELQVVIERVRVQEKALAEDAERRRQEAQELLKVIRSRDEAVLRLQEENARLKAEALRHKLEAETMQARLEQLVKAMAELQRTLAKEKLAEPPPRAKDTSNPPDALIDGKIVGIEAKAGVVLLNIGADEGLKVNHTLEVFRLEPPRYLGRVIVIEVMAHQSVGRLLPPARPETLMKGDRVSSRLDPK